MTYFNIRVITSERNYPDDVAISDDGTMFGNHHHPLVISILDFLSLFRKMAVIASRLALHDVMRYDDNFKEQKLHVDFNLFDDALDDGAILYLKMLRLDEAYNERFKELAKRDGKINWNAMERKIKLHKEQYNLMHGLYNKLIFASAGF